MVCVYRSEFLEPSGGRHQFPQDLPPPAICQTTLNQTHTVGVHLNAAPETLLNEGAVNCTMQETAAAVAETTLQPLLE